MIANTSAIVLNKLKFSDSGIIVNLYTKTYGRLAVIVKGTRSRKSKVRNNLFETLNVIDIELDYKEKRELQTIREVNLKKPLHQLRMYPEKAAIGFFLAEIISKSLNEEDSSPKTFDFIESNIFHLEKLETGFQNFHLSFLLHLMGYLGFEPSISFSDETPFFNLREGMFLPVFTNDDESLNLIQSKLLINLYNIKPYQSGQIKMKNSERRVMITKILNYYRFHIDGFGKIKSLDVLHELFNS